MSATRPPSVPEVTRGRRALFYTVAALLPFVLLALVEVTLRLTWRSAATPLFVKAAVERGDYLVANRSVSRRWFITEQSPPAPIPEPFLATKPAHAFRCFVLGESSAAGFPYPHNGTFSRLLRDALADVLPGDTVEVINLGIPATNSYAMLDMANEVIAQHPDAVLIYAGHNEYYGALGAASTESAFGGVPSLVRVYLVLQRLRIVMAMRSVIASIRRGHPASSSQDSPPPPPSFMESLARDQAITLNGRGFARGTHQFEENLHVLLRRFRDAHVPVFIGSLASNVRDQAPLASPANGVAGGADSTYAKAIATLARGDTSGARALFVRARDLDVVRFRAPSAFNAIIKRVAAGERATYVPVAERFDSAAAGRIPGHDLFLEHVHPNQRGTAILGLAYFDALRAVGFLGHSASLERLRSWSSYVAGMTLTPFDHRVAYHTRQTLLARWPFVAASAASDYRSTYHPTGVVDSLSFLVSRGLPWAPAKVALSQWYQASGKPDSAVAELRGVVRDAALFAEPWELLGQTAMGAGENGLADTAFRRALAIRPSASDAAAAGMLALKRKDMATALPLLGEAVRLDPTRPDVLYQLSLAYGLTHDIANARTTAIQLARLSPQYPGLADWLRVIGLAP